jgi:calcium-dependent protein kinase
MNGEAPMSDPVGTAYYMSPELLKGKHERSTNIWSIGIMTYILLCGYPPFSGETNDDIFDAIRRGHFDFLTPAWSDKSNKAKDFIRRLLRRDP